MHFFFFFLGRTIFGNMENLWNEDLSAKVSSPFCCYVVADLFIFWVIAQEDFCIIRNKEKECARWHVNIFLSTHTFPSWWTALKHGGCLSPAWWNSKVAVPLAGVFFYASSSGFRWWPSSVLCISFCKELSSIFSTHSLTHYRVVLPRVLASNLLTLHNLFYFYFLIKVCCFSLLAVCLHQFRSEIEARMGRQPA